MHHSKPVKLGKKCTPWITKQILFSKRQKNLLKKKASISKTERDWQDFKIARNSYNKLVKASISQYYTGEISKNKGNAKNTWKTINNLINKSKKSSNVNEICDKNGKPSNRYK